MCLVLISSKQDEEDSAIMNSLSSEQLFLTEAAKALLENQEHSPFLNLSRYQLWDLAGIDSLQLAKLLVSDGVTKIALFESVDFIFTGYQYSALRLGEGKFRLGLYGELGTYGGLNFEETIEQSQVGLEVWAKRCDKLKATEVTASYGMIGLTECCAISLTACCAIALPQSVAHDLLPKIAVVQPPHCLEELQPNFALPAKIENLPVLIWRHQLLSQPVFELHTAVQDAEAIKLKLINI